MLYANDINDNRVYIADIQQGQSYYCPLCGQELIIKQGTKKIHHFAHKSLKDCDTWSEGMSDWHLEWQQRFTHKNKDLAEVVLAVNGEKHRADIMVNSLVIEFQHSPISQDEFNKRNEFYGKDNNVVWVFDVRDKHITYKRNNKNNKYYCTWKWASMTEYKYNDTIDVYMQVSDNLLIRYEGHREGNKYFNGHGYTVQDFIEHMRNIVRLQKQTGISKLDNTYKQLIDYYNWLTIYPNADLLTKAFMFFDNKCALSGYDVGYNMETHKPDKYSGIFDIGGVQFPFKRYEKIKHTYHKGTYYEKTYYNKMSTEYTPSGVKHFKNIDTFTKWYKRQCVYNEDRMQKIKQWYNMNIS